MDSDPVPDPLSWMTSDAIYECIVRKTQIEEELLAMGANKEYCLQYFQSGGGVCEKMVGGRCMRHRPGSSPLPKGRVCATDFPIMAAELRRRVSEVETQRLRLKHEWDMLKTDEGMAIYAETIDPHPVSCRWLTQDSCPH